MRRPDRGPAGAKKKAALKPAESLNDRKLYHAKPSGVKSLPTASRPKVKRLRHKNHPRSVFTSLILKHVKMYKITCYPS